MSGPRLPLAMANVDEVVRVAQVRGESELRQHLAELGFVDGAEVRVVSKAGGDVIVSVKGTRLALNRSMASHIAVAL